MDAINRRRAELEADPSLADAAASGSGYGRKRKGKKEEADEHIAGASSSKKRKKGKHDEARGAAIMDEGRGQSDEEEEESNAPTQRPLPPAPLPLSNQPTENDARAIAAGALLSEVRDPIVRAQISRIHQAIPPQGRPPTRMRSVPSRHRRWGPLLELSQQILDGFDADDQGFLGRWCARALGPGHHSGAMLERKAERAGLNGPGALARNDVYPFFAALGDLIISGPTGTNVGDVQVLLVG